jgi:predicted GTPase
MKRSTPSLISRMLEQTINAINYADLTLFVVDGREGVTEIDMRLARWLRS